MQSGPRNAAERAGLEERLCALRIVRDAEVWPENPCPPLLAGTAVGWVPRQWRPIEPRRWKPPPVPQSERTASYVARAFDAPPPAPIKPPSLIVGGVHGSFVVRRIYEVRDARGTWEKRYECRCLDCGSERTYRAFELSRRPNCRSCAKG
jgi:hypothetical protein